ncbi:MAG: bifunctional UDP-sugar hydrolase/5'-nucleotidase [Peptostreptococcaceae bacterium]
MEKTLKIYYTSDTHGYLFKSNNGSILQCISEFKKDNNTLIIDGGDTIQGSPLLKYLWENDKFDKVIPKFFNLGKYDYYTLGNHDFNYGYDGLSKFVNAMNAKCIVCNVVDTSNKLKFDKYIIHTLENGLKIGITGAVTSWVNVWEPASNLENLIIEDTFSSLKETFEIMKDKCDIKICIYHGGYEEDLKTKELLKHTDENIACKISRELDFDLLLTGHQHAKIENTTIYNTHTVQPPSNASMYIKVDLIKSEDSLEINSKLIKPSENILDSLLKVSEPIKEESDKWLLKQIGNLKEEVPFLEKIDMAVNGSKIADLNNLVQLDATNADISCTSLHNAPINLPKKITVSDVLRVMPYPNEVIVKEISGQTLLNALKRSASYFDIKDNKVIVSKKFLIPKEEHYNYDYFANVEYSVDLNTKEIYGVFIKGEKLDLKKMYTIAMSDYRATGTGGYDDYKTSKVIMTHNKDMQQLLMNYLQKNINLEIPSLSKINIKK